MTQAQHTPETSRGESFRLGNVLARAAAVTAGLTVAGALLGLVRDQAIAQIYGASVDSDAFLIAWTVPEMAATLLIEDAMALLLVPAFSHALAERAAHRPDPVRTLVGSTFPKLFAVLAAATGVLMVFTPQFVAALAPGFADPELAVDCTRLTALTVLTFGLAGYFSAALRAHGRFVPPAGVYVAYNTGIIATTIALHALWGVRAAAAGVAVGGALMVLVQLPTFAHHVLGARPRARGAGGVPRPRSAGPAGAGGETGKGADAKPAADGGACPHRAAARADAASNDGGPSTRRTGGPEDACLRGAFGGDAADDERTDCGSAPAGGGGVRTEAGGAGAPGVDACADGQAAGCADVRADAASGGACPRSAGGGDGRRAGAEEDSAARTGAGAPGAGPVRDAGGGGTAGGPTAGDGSAPADVPGGRGVAGREACRAASLGAEGPGRAAGRVDGGGPSGLVRGARDARPGSARGGSAGAEPPADRVGAAVCGGGASDDGGVGVGRARAGAPGGGGRGGYGVGIALLAPIVFFAVSRQSQVLVERFLASSLPSGAISHLNYAQKVAQMPMVLSLMFCTVTFPVVAKAMAEGDREGARRRVENDLALAGLVVLLGTALILGYAPQIIEVLFQRGAFDAEDTESTATVMRVYAVGLLGHTLVGALGRPFFSSGRPTWYPAAAMAGGLVVTVVAGTYAVGPWGVYGIAGANAAGITTTALLLLRGLGSRVVSIEVRAISRALGRLAVAAAAAALAGRLAAGAVDGALSSLAVGALLVPAVFTVTGLAVRAPEVVHLLALTRRRIARHVR
ncbi:lipid II flippase MurJ [Streptomyces sp. NPDC048057]|uniref:lipid II flippase MurJ n=1 Tax=Streptomyces sp. NPDC048057 TaxID=3155628 RepID=UPI0033DFB8D7